MEPFNEFMARAFKTDYRKSSIYIEEAFHGRRSFRTNRLSFLLFKRDEFDEDMLQTVSVTKGKKYIRNLYKKYY